MKVGHKLIKRKVLAEMIGMSQSTFESKYNRRSLNDYRVNFTDEEFERIAEARFEEIADSFSLDSEEEFELFINKFKNYLFKQ
jgi:hypothetical protein